METYDPDVEPPATEWLETDEAERILLVESYHRRRRIRVPQLALTAMTMHGSG